MNTVVRLAPLVGACMFAGALAAGSDSEAAEPPAQAVSQSSPAAPPEATAQSPTTAASTSSTTAEPATPASAEKKPTKVVVLVDETLNGAQLKQILAKGYRPQGRGDHVFYCRREAELGTRFQKTVCKTATAILDQELQGKAVTERAQRDTGSPMGH